MKRFYWLLALPYVVTASTWSMVTRCSDEIDPCIDMNSPCCNPSKTVHTDYKAGDFTVEDNKEEAEDLAAALNEAHERREADEILNRKDLKEVPWKDSKKAEWINIPVDSIPIKNPPDTPSKPLRVITNKEACGSDDCGEDK